MLISKIGLRLIFIVGIVFIASMVLLNIMRKFIESYLLGYGNMDPKKFARIYNTVSLGFIIVVIVTCILVILSIVNKWVQYLNYMILKLRRISEIQYVDDLDINGDDELSELASSINVMSNKLKDNYEREKKIEKEKNDFIVAVSHDLRTPLTSIIGYLDLLKNEKIQSYEKTSEYIDITYRKAIDLKNLIEELFEYTKIENDYVSLEKVEFNIAILVNQILGEQMLFFKEKNINIEFESESNEIYCEIDIKKNG
ncbi:HAMP domain-containing histidine kinase [Clostridium botulinum]|nr:HAMP domain-containing histidine kinase [Clostridium botulinum]